MSRTIRLPWPPSVNRIWRNIVIKGAPRTLLSRDGREYREAVAAVVLETWGRLTGTQERLRVSVVACPPDRRKRDLSNCLKAFEDALTHANVWADDSQIDDLRIVRGPVRAPGYLDVTIERIASGQLCFDETKGGA